MIVPTGTGATIGGFAGDSLSVARAMSSVVDCLITHPNVSEQLHDAFFFPVKALKFYSVCWKCIYYLCCYLNQVLNGAMLYWPMAQTLYVEGYALDRFAEGAWGLQPVHQNRVC